MSELHRLPLGIEDATAAPLNATAETILNTAEQLFVERGYAEVSLRELTAAANVNLAAVHYHFGSKEKLLLAIFKRGAAILNNERFRLLREAEDQAQGKAPPVREVIHALLAPAIHFTLTTARLSLYNQIVAVAQLDGSPELRELLERDVRHLQRFAAVLAKSLPELPRHEIFWRLHFVMGVQHSLYTGLNRLDALSSGTCRIDDLDAVVARAVDFAAAGMTAPFKPGPEREATQP